MPLLVGVRHGQSQWNLENRFTGWADVPLTEKGIEEARHAGRLLKENGYAFDMAYTSFQIRAQNTLKLLLEEMGVADLPTTKAWELNERHYGGLTGLNKNEMREKYGEEQVHIWRRSFDIPPPEPTEPLEKYPGFGDGRYDEFGDVIPTTESLKNTTERVIPYWDSAIAPQLRAGKRIIIAAHGNSLRALVKHLSGISDTDIPGVEIPTGKPFVYELDDALKPVKDYYYL